MGLALSHAPSGQNHVLTRNKHLFAAHYSTCLIPSVHLTGGIANGLAALPGLGASPAITGSRLEFNLGSRGSLRFKDYAQVIDVCACRAGDNQITERREEPVRVVTPLKLERLELKFVGAR